MVWIMEIKVQMSSDGIWGSDPQNTVGLDVAASEENLINMVHTQVQIDYPDAAVDVEVTLNDSVKVDGDVGGLDAETVADTIHDVWADWEWTIARTTVRVGDRVEEKSKCGCEAVWRVEHIVADITHLHCVTASTCPECTERGSVFGRHGWTCRMPLFELKPTEDAEAEWRML